MHPRLRTRVPQIVIKLKADEANFATKWHVESNIRRYSNFVGFPIQIDGERVNTVDAIWTKSKNEVSQEQHNEFYRYVSQSFDDPRYTWPPRGLESLTRALDTHRAAPGALGGRGLARGRRCWWRGR